MPKTKRDVLKRRCSSILKHINAIQRHIDIIKKLYAERPETQVYDLLLTYESLLFALRLSNSILKRRL